MSNKYSSASPEMLEDLFHWVMVDLIKPYNFETRLKFHSGINKHTVDSTFSWYEFAF